ncbi:A disintegrin and metalloproteinase with thrombospondin motifs 7 [Eumeta japonica]|uniref:ATP-dependent DNA helicase n=1 Tax=Eumeta variegata TaxID=151549 RepID=A0A4C1ZYP4_EUMVA|nr:A disintegrin and metalloproteinase with thrombospondin motifs 7 [Eumeta japonica]
MKNGICSKRFPKSFATGTVTGEDGYPFYRRSPENGEKKNAIAVASSDKATTLLPEGKTAHSMFKIPLDLDRVENAVCSLPKNNLKAKVVQDFVFIEWDECTMTNKISIEAVNRTMQDIRSNNLLFGGVIFLFAGDFRQILPVKGKSKLRVPRRSGFKYRARDSKAQHERGHLRRLYMETLVVLDKTLIDYHNSTDLDNYVMTCMNIAHAALSDSTFGAPLELVVVKIIRLEAEDDEMNLAVTQNAEHVLKVFQAWAEAINPPYDSHPLHHDLAILITRVDICFAGGEDCGLLGLTCLGCCCDNSLSAIVAEDNGLVLGYTIAHEIGHTVGMYHDGDKGGEDESGCPTHPYGDNYAVLMTVDVGLRMRGWSNCSREFLWAWLDTGQGECLYDDPATDTRAFNEILPGASFGVQSQCRAKLSKEVAQCVDVAVECENMKCYVPKYGCIETHTPLADGTECGEHSWCFHGKCIDEGMRPKVIDGEWSEWGPYSSCSRTCGGGVSRSVRHCDNPPPSSGGEYCLGQRVKYQMCNTKVCPHGEPSYRDVQCTEFDQWVYPETNSTHTWKSATGGDENPCELVCINEEKEKVILKPQVTDGTECYLGEHHVCVSGLCKPVGCDQTLDSKAVEDQCGVCHGDGTTCTVQSEEKHFEKQGNSNYCKLPTVKTTNDTNMTHTDFEVQYNARNFAAVKYENSEECIVLFLYLRKKYGVTMVGPVRLWLGAPRHNQELAVFEETTIKYTITTPEPAGQGSYSWAHLGWTDCSEPCGPGTELSEAKCVDKEKGMVEDMYCELADKPSPLQRVCELRPCESSFHSPYCHFPQTLHPISRCLYLKPPCWPSADRGWGWEVWGWVIGEWLGCNCDCEDEMEERSVFCAKLSNANEMLIVDDVVCPLRPKLFKQTPKLFIQTSNQAVRFWQYLLCYAGLVVVFLLGPSIDNSDNSVNIKRIKEMKGAIVSDYENLNNTDLALEVEEETRRNPIQDFPKPIDNQNLVHLRGKAAELEWSPDEELVVVVTKNLNAILMSCSFDPLTEVNLTNEEFGEKEFITVGWGKKETQFHGSEGKQAAKTKIEVHADPSLPIDTTVNITWRGDSQFYAVGFTVEGIRRFKVFDRDGHLQYTSEKQPGLEPNLSWSPSGNIIATTQKLPNKYVVAAFEKNGLKHGDFAVPVNTTTVISDLSWSSDSDRFLLCIELSKSGLKALIQYEVTPQKEIYKRKIETGAELVIVVSNDTRTVFQMPRGNLEVIQPRPLSLKIIGEYLDNFKYHEAFDLMRKQRINLNLLVDHDPEKFINYVDVFLDSIKNNSWLNVFISDLDNVDVTKTMYSSSYINRNNNNIYNINDKVSVICDTLRSHIVKRPDRDNKILPLLTTFVKKNTIEDLENALTIIKELKKLETSGSKLPVGSDESLKYLLYMVDVNDLFDIALGMYDFDLVLLIAAKSQKDPKEFVPMLNEFNEMEENYKCFSINKHLKRYHRAVECLAKCGPEYYSEFRNFVKYHSLYGKALELFSPNVDLYKQISDDYGQYLKLKKNFTEAGIVYRRAGNVDKAVECFKEALEWELAIELSCSWSKDAFQELCWDLVNNLRDLKRHEESLILLEKYCDDQKKTISYAVACGHYRTALRLCGQLKETGIKEAVVLPALVEEFNNLNELFKTNSSTFKIHKERLQIVRENKSKKSEEFYDVSFANKDSDLYSDAGSTLASSASRSSSRTFRSSKNRRKHERKVASLKEGSQYEDVALVMALHTLVTATFNMRSYVKEVNVALCCFNMDKEALMLQNGLDKLLNEMKDSFKQIWTNELVLEATNASIAALNIPEGSSVNLQGIATLEPHIIIAPIIKHVDWKLNGLQ